MDTRQQFSGFWAIILGGSSGFGWASVEKLAANGMNIALLYRETAGAEKLLQQKIALLAAKSACRIAAHNINALHEEGIKQFIGVLQEEGVPKKSVRLLLHSIARGNLKPLIGSEDAGRLLTTEDIQLTSYAMSNSLLDWTRTLLGNEYFFDDARVIGLSSEGTHKYWDSYAAVSIAKASLESLATYMAVEFAPYGLRTNIIQAGITETPSFNKIPGSRQLADYTITRNPFGRITQPADVANVIYLLCTDEAAWINGALIHVDGGEHCR